MTQSTAIIATVREVVRERRIATIKLDTRRPSYLYLHSPPANIEAIVGIRLHIDDDSIFVGQTLWAIRKGREIILAVKGGK